MQARHDKIKWWAPMGQMKLPGVSDPVCRLYFPLPCSRLFPGMPHFLDTVFPRGLSLLHSRPLMEKSLSPPYIVPSQNKVHVLFDGML